MNYVRREIRVDRLNRYIEAGGEQHGCQNPDQAAADADSVERFRSRDAVRSGEETAGSADFGKNHDTSNIERIDNEVQTLQIARKPAARIPSCLPPCGVMYRR